MINLAQYIEISDVNEFGDNAHTNPLSANDYNVLVRDAHDNLLDVNDSEAWH